MSSGKWRPFCVDLNVLIHDVTPLYSLTHWGRVTHICVSKLTIIGSDNGLSPDRRQAIIRTSAGILSIRPLGTKLSEILIAFHIFSFKKIHMKMSSGKWQLSCLGLNVLSAGVLNGRTPTWPLLCLQMAQHLTVLGHQQVQWWLQYHTCFLLNIFAYRWFQIIILVQMT